MTIEQKKAIQNIAQQLKEAAISAIPDAVQVSIAMGLEGPVAVQMCEVRIGRASGAGWESVGFPINKQIDG